MYIPTAFALSDRATIFQAIRSTGLATLVTASAEGPMVTPLPLFLDDSEGEFGTLYGHVARANPHWRTPVIGHAMALFMGPDAYVSPSWYVSKAEHGKVVPTWNYQIIEAVGTIEFFDDRDRLHALVSRLTDLHEGKRAKAWRVDDAPCEFIEMQLRAIVGVRLPITALQGKSKMSQNRNAADRAGVIEGLRLSEAEREREVAPLIPT
ncbi:FMN-binding negative transcriptional regulator [Rhizobium sp. C4]|uniref:FMN-binding negative transcriptional regulator n=1 Tax=Rhizobium sp. C4 TaxID=1349800 RepID=UPI001E53B1FB|nr:FMN-binding negative transcriptional regulator [Rhizobium sp. C4]MCD2171793.1 FMN-binding negative transcriptional regulator [Rhizobium sp. C4]